MPFMILPTTITVGGVEYEIDSDYRTAISTQIAQSDFELTDRERAWVTLYLLIPNADEIPREQAESALNECMAFLAGGKIRKTKNEKKKHPRLVDWEQDFDLIVSAVNKIAGHDVRGDKYLHWWTFRSWYCEIDSKSLFSQVVQLRSKLAKREKLDKADRKFYESNRDLIEFERKYSEKENELFRQLGV